MSEALSNLIDALREDLEEIGLYGETVAVFGDQSLDDLDEDVEPDIKKMIQDDDAQFIVAMTVGIGDVAWTDRVLTPEKFEKEQEFQKAMPDEAEIVKEQLRRRLRGE